MIYEFFADGFEEVEALSIVDILRRGGCEVKTVSIMGSKTVTGAHGIPVTTDIMFDEADYSDAELLALPGGMPGASNLLEHKGLNKILLAQNEGGKRIGAICAAPAVVLGNLGLVKGKKATCYPDAGLEGQLNGAAHVDDIVVTDGNITTSRGPATAMAFAIELVRLMKGDRIADEVRDGLLA